MDTRQPYLIGYDVSDPRRLRRVLQAVRTHALDGQKSFYTCWLTPGELRNMLSAIEQQLDPQADRALVLRLRADAVALNLGAAVLDDPDDCIVLH